MIDVIKIMRDAAASERAALEFDGAEYVRLYRRSAPNDVLWHGDYRKAETALEHFVTLAQLRAVRAAGCAIYDTSIPDGDWEYLEDLIPEDLDAVPPPAEGVA